MEKPLWKIFKELKSELPYSLSIDQYTYFVKALSQLSFKHFKNGKSLREYTKIFWLKDDKHEDDYNDIFDKFIQFESVFKELLKEAKFRTNPKSTPTIKEKDNDAIIKKDKNTNQPPEPIINTPNSTSSTTEISEFVNFDLVIKEEEGTASEPDTLIEMPKHSFLLSDQYIYPFSLRFFSQRLRRKVQRPIKTQTQELDYYEIINEFSKNRYIENLIFQTKDSSKSNIILLADREGSMLGYEFLEEHLTFAIQAIPDCRFEHYFFYNLPQKSDDRRHYLLNELNGKNRQVNTCNQKWNEDSWFFIFSDAGAHSDSVNFSRLKAILKMWKYFHGISKHVYWINPVPPEYRKKSTAQRLSLIIPMLYPTTENLNDFFNQI